MQGFQITVNFQSHHKNYTPQKSTSNLIGWRRTIVCFWHLWLVHCCGRRWVSMFCLLTHNITNEMAEEEVEQTSGILQEIFTSPLNISLLCLCLFLLYKIVRGDKPADFGPVEEPLPKLKKRDFTLAELQEYDGLKNPRILMAINEKVFDVTRGKKFYGPGNMRISQIHSWVLFQTYLRWFFYAFVYFFKGLRDLLNYVGIYASYSFLNITWKCINLISDTPLYVAPSKQPTNGNS